MSIRNAVFVLIFAALAGCATYTEKQSPCVCDWERINQTEETFA